MKKNGFTLAEVLITLAIIGVVATLTLPSLMSNTQEQQAITGFRKAMNTLNEAGQMNAAVDGFDYGGVSVAGAANSAVYDANGVLTQSIWALLASKTQLDVSASRTGGITGQCAGRVQAFFRDGTVLCYTDAQPNGAINGRIIGYVDTNGRKGPNQASSCTDVNCRQGKNIRDQFRVTLVRSMAVPGHVTVDNNGTITDGNNAEDNAAMWAMRK